MSQIYEDTSLKVMKKDNLFPSLVTVDLQYSYLMCRLYGGGVRGGGCVTIFEMPNCLC